MTTGPALLVGRDREQASLRKCLDSSRRQPALVLVTGGPGMGKTSLLRWIGERAREDGWNVVSGEGQKALFVTHATTAKTFLSQLLGLLPSLNASIHGSSRIRPLVEQLGQLAPVLVLIDGYRPNATFADWFKDTFLRELSRVSAAIVVIVADRQEQTDALERVADENIVIGPPETEAVRQHFGAIGQLIVPQMQEGELEAYVKAACRDPRRLSILTQLLWLARAEDNSASKPMS